MDQPPDRATRVFASRQEQLARIIALVVVFAVPGIFCLYLPVNNADLWWHFASARWILQHHAVPYTDPFSAYGAGKFWAAYSWLFEVIVFQMFRRWGLAGVLAFTAGMTTLIVVALYRMIQRLLPDFTLAVFLTLAAVFCFCGLFSPRPWLFTILFFILEFDILLQARSTGKRMGLFLLPLLFVLWANTHIEFVYGLLVLGLAVIEPVVERWWPARQTQLRFAALWPILVACLAATLVNPYGWRVYQIVGQYAGTPGTNFVLEMNSLAFRTPNEYVLLFLTFACVGALAWTRRIPFFEFAVFATAATVTFRTRREIWLLAVVAAAILAAALPVKQHMFRKLHELALPCILAASGLLVWCFAALQHLNNEHLQAQLASEMPVRAVAAIKSGNYRGPLFNTFDWGGYLIWDLGMPVSIDPRTNVYGDEYIVRNIDTWMGNPDGDRNLESAGIVIGPVANPLTYILRLDPRFQLVYEDNLAAVFVRRKSP